MSTTPRQQCLQPPFAIYREIMVSLSTKTWELIKVNEIPTIFTSCWLLLIQQLLRSTIEQRHFFQFSILLVLGGE